MKLLIIEDSPELLDFLIELLEEEGHEVSAAEEGVQGLYLAQNWEFDVILLDAMLPGLDGFSLLERLRKTHTTPVLMLTARDQTRDRVRGLDQGADDYLVKPFANDELLARIRAVARRHGLQSEKLLRIGAVEIDTGSLQIRAGGEPVEVTAREFALVELLARHRSEVVSRDRIFGQLFDEESEDVDISNLLDVYIYKLRQKLGKDFIKTRRGAGYFIE
ncbi:two-component system OmpR family response regulator [Haloferula luteola]|uniref:Two-component system OmpR family response regulator n=1 Tax=Haloferula luteola TaxID=595692 RepID=A0A840V6Y8_9BACT|nr:two-component system OmpR family response regulator [Haloferula luteola]